MKRLAFCLLLACLLLALPTGRAEAATCNATVTDIEFGTIAVRAGAVNQTSGNVRIECTALVSVVGVCLRFGPGSGGAGGGNNPRYMRNATGDTLAYQLRPLGNGAVFGTLNQIFVSVPVVLGTGRVNVPIFADILSSGVDVDSGSYSSTF
ncbi:fimbrial major subunit CsuA/B family protein [Pseudohalocynthiibacter aestuariivivens]|nr:spore coat protein U domain-containing protein [Pseudohalocynthiibacter aestuariivivens]QIE45812.1 fimbrial major subunit CsuA/B family protein [Pseudohalocynthiibacter aestuariivivens]